MISTRQVEITTAIRATDEQLAEVRKKLEKLNVIAYIWEEIEATESKADALRQVEEDVKR
jgi:uncharacterized protein Yka (UPF0111/DUF47 family)